MIVLLGGSGYVGSVFERKLELSGEPYEVLNRSDCDFLDEKSLYAKLEGINPTFVICAAGYVGRPNVDACETNKTDCLAGNAVMPGVFAKVCKKLNVPWGFVSSGCIFTGRATDGGGFKEDDVPNFSFRQNNCSFYSGCKALGEEALGYEAVIRDGREYWLNSNPEEGYIWRLRIPFDQEASPRNYLQKIISYKTLLDVENSFGCLDDFVNACLECWSKRVPFGIYNVTNPGSLTTREVTDLIREESKRRDEKGLPNPFPQKFSFFEDESSFMKTAASTPRSSCVLDSSKLIDAGVPMRPLEEAVRDCLSNWSELE